MSVESDSSERPEDPTDSSRGRSALVAVLWLAAVAALLLAVSTGWFLHAWISDKDSISVNRPIEVTENQPIASGYVPNVLGLTEESAVQALVDSGVAPNRITSNIVPHVGDAGQVVKQSPGPGTKLADKTVVINLSGPATMPNLIGISLDMARDRMAEIGAKVTTTTRYKSGARENEVLATSPAPNDPLVDSAKLIVAEPLSSVFVSDLQSLDSSCSAASATIDGKVFDDSLVCEPGDDSPGTASFQLNRRLDTFSAEIGLDDSGADSEPVRFIVRRDRNIVEDMVLRFGERRTIKVSVVGALRLKLEVIGRSADEDAVKAAWGDARFIGASSSVDALQAADEQP